MTERATDPQVAWYASNDPTVEWNKAWNVHGDVVLLAREVQASRKLAADLLALHHQHAPVAHFSYPYCRACQHPYPCPTVQLIEASGCSADT